MSAICLIQYPYYHRIQDALDEAGTAVHLFEDLNITWLMLQALPSVDEVFEKCYWQGHRFNCSSLFFLQRTEIGFCYAFNSLTSENRRHCVGEPRLTSGNSDSCQVWRNVAGGALSGLEIFLRTPPAALGHRWDNRYRLMINEVSSVPNSLRNHLIPSSTHHVTVVELEVSVTESSPQIEQLPTEKRRCLFANERHLILSRYSQVACTVECRLEYMLRVCNCTTYVFNQISGDLRFHRPRDSINSGSKFMDGSINCSTCLPTCFQHAYTLDIYTEEENYINLNGPYIDVHYTKNSAIKYERILAFTPMELVGIFVNQLDNEELTLSWYEQDGTTCHTSRVTMAEVKSLFPGRVILKGLWHLWPCDLRSDFSLGWPKRLRLHE
ncbi:sodium channel protein Nach-like [Schistocerca piceifrons]|uniref:sodium channel protein Nach-like n=1 Tax=Schistocerca piceifrons TaxID=274613 RepID=UPI001F5FA1D6|nr:sodium channel protein Nach-like [Schistocerca piceifrons]